MELLSHCNRFTKFKALRLFKCAKYSKRARTWPRVYKNSIDVIPAKRIRVFIIHCILKNIKLITNSCRPQAELMYTYIILPQPKQSLDIIWTM